MTQISTEPRRTKLHGWLWLAIASAMLVLLILGLRQAAPERYTIDLQTSTPTALTLPSVTTTKIFQETLKSLAPEVYRSLQTEADTAVRQQLALELERLTAEVNALDQAIVQYVTPLIKQIRVDTKQSNLGYSQEFRQALEQQTFAPLDFKQPETLIRTSQQYLTTAKRLAAIAPSKHFYNFHLFWVTNLASQAYILQELGQKPSADRQLVLLHYLNELVKLQNQAVAQLKQ